MAKANAVTGTTVYVAEGAPVPDELPAGVRLVGPGAPAEGRVQEPHAQTVAEQGEGEQPSPGTSFSASTGTPPSSGEPNSSGRRKPARATGRRSSRDQVESSTAPSTATSGPETDASDN